MTHAQFLLKPLSALIMLSGSTYTFAQYQQEKTDTDLPIIVVTAQDNRSANGLIVHADPKQPIQPVPATDGADYLQSIMGFNQIKSGGTNGDVTFRGMFGSRIKILTDGTENLGACPSRMDAPTSYINPESFDQITVIKGPQTVQYANTGSAATVMFDREPEKFNTDEHYRGQASVMIGSFGRLDHNIEAAVGDETKYARLNANRSVADNYKDGDGHTVQSSWNRWNADLALGWTPTTDTWVELRGGRADGEAAYAGRSMDGSQFKRDSLGLHVQQKNVTNLIKKIEAQIDYSYNDHIMDNFSLRQPPAMPMAMEVTRRTVNARAAMTTEWDNFSVISGIDSQQNKHASNMYMRDVPTPPPLTGDLKFQSYGAFSEWTYAFNPNRKLVAGARVDHVQVDNTKNTQQRQDTNPSGFIRIENNAVQQDLTSYLGIGYVERSPDYWELYKASNNDLNYLATEKTTQLDTGFEFKHKAWNTWASAYAGLIQDFILVPYKGNKNLAARGVDATIAGAEAGVGYQFSDHIQTDISAMYAWGENRTDHRPLPQIAPLEGRINLRYVQDKYTLGALWRVVAQQNRYSLDQGNIVGYDIGPSAGFATVSINASYKLMKDIDIAIGIDNLLDKTYAEHLNRLGSAGFGYAATEQFNNIGRNYWARMSMKF